MILYLQKLWINLVDTGQGVSAYSSKDKSLNRGVKGEVRQYANGRQRAVSSKGVKGVFQFTLEDVTQTTLNILENWLTQTVVVRDTRGRRFFGVVFEVSVTDRRNVNYYVVNLTLNEVTYTEGT